MNAQQQQIVDYIQGALERGDSRESMEGALLANGWSQMDVDTAFAKIGQNDTLSTQSDVEHGSESVPTKMPGTHYRDWRSVVAIVSLVSGCVALLGVVMLSLNQRFPLMIVVVFMCVALVSGVVGAGSRHSVMAWFGIVLGLIELCVIGFAGFIAYTVLTTGRTPFSDEMLTEQEMRDDFGLTEGEIAALRK